MVQPILHPLRAISSSQVGRNELGGRSILAHVCHEIMMYNDYDVLLLLNAYTTPNQYICTPIFFS